MDVLIASAMALTVVLLAVLFISWGIHVSMNKDTNLPYGWGNFSKFKREFNSYKKWEAEEWHKGSFCGRDTKYYIHADIIKFNNRCMILDPISYVLFKMWCRKKWKSMTAVEKIKW